MSAKPAIGVGRPFRDSTWLERLAARVRGAAGATGLAAALRPAFRALLAASARDRLVATLPGGERVRLDPAHRQLAWNAEEYAAFKAATPRGATVLDVGANLGAYTVLFAQWAGPGGRVFAFEPAPATRAGLARQLALNGVAAFVTVRPEAVAASSGTRPFRADGLQGDNRLDAASAGGLDVPTTSIDEFCAREGVRPDVIKIDVEGAELDALRGARQTIARGGGRLAVFVELHPSVWPRLGISRGEIEAELDFQQLALERIDADGDPWSIEGVCLRLRSSSPRDRGK
jgi:FkbM family methyltransferase